jgi:hypothetical protein
LAFFQPVKGARPKYYAKLIKHKILARILNRLLIKL